MATLILLTVAILTWRQPLGETLTLYPNYSVKEAAKDFDALNVWLVKNVPHVDDPEVNLMFAEEKLEKLRRSRWSLRESSLMKPIEMLNELSNVVECDDRTLELIRYIHLSSQNGKRGLRRIDKLFSHYAHLASLKCEPYLDGRFIDLYENCLQKEPIENLFEVIRPKFMTKRTGVKENKGWFEYLLSWRRSYQYFNHRDLLDAMLELARDDPRGTFVEKKPNELTGKVDRHVNKANVKYVYETYLARPCRHYKTEMEKFVDTFYAIKDYQNMKSELNTQFVERRGEFVQVGVFRYLICEGILDNQKTLGGVEYLIDDL